MPLPHGGRLVDRTVPDAEVKEAVSEARGLKSLRLDAEQAAKYKEVFLSNFNAAVTENALKWHAMERRQGEVDYSIVDAMLAWTEQHDIPLRGHNIYWGIPGRVQAWQKELDDDERKVILSDNARRVFSGTALTR